MAVTVRSGQVWWVRQGASRQLGLGLVRRGAVRSGLVWHGVAVLARIGRFWRVPAWRGSLGADGPGRARFGLVFCGMDRQFRLGKARCDLARHGGARQSRIGSVRYGAARYSRAGIRMAVKARHGMARSGVAGQSGMGLSGRGNAWMGNAGNGSRGMSRCGKARQGPDWQERSKT